MTAARTDNAPDHPRRSDHSPLARPPARLTASMQPQCSAVGRLYPGVLPPMMSLEVRAVTTPGGRPAGSVAPGRAVCGPGVGGGVHRRRGDAPSAPTTRNATLMASLFDRVIISREAPPRHVAQRKLTDSGACAMSRPAAIT